ncbi:hypothetical protein ScPMuIL_004911 [Solemya velum]
MNTLTSVLPRQVYAREELFWNTTELLKQCVCVNLQFMCTIYHRRLLQHFMVSYIYIYKPVGLLAATTST